MKSKDIICMFLLLFLIYLVMKPNVEGYVRVHRRMNTPQNMRELVTDLHSSR